MRLLFRKLWYALIGLFGYKPLDIDPCGKPFGQVTHDWETSYYTLHPEEHYASEDYKEAEDRWNHPEGWE